MIKTSNQLYGMVRDLVDPNEKFDHGKDKKDYDKLASFVIEFVQKQMQLVYNLQEIWIPEK